MSTVDTSCARWRKSSYSSGNGGGNDSCIEVATLDAEWRKSTYSGGNGGGNDNCVEIAFAGPAAAIRDSKNATGPVLAVPASAWRQFVRSTTR